MSWLLHLLRKLFGKSTKQKALSKHSEPSFSQQKNNEQSIEESVAVASRSQGETVRVAPSVLPEQDQQTIMESPMIAPDTHRRIDAAPAATPGTPPTIPSFPTEVSELITSVDSLRPVEDVGKSADLVTNNQREDDQLPEIHDLLPAVEPDSPEQALPTEEESENSDDDTQSNLAETDVESSVSPGVDIPEQPGAIEDLPVARRDSSPVVQPSSEYQNAHQNLQNRSEHVPPQTETVPPPNLEDSSHAQSAILYSFDITESETPTLEREEAASNSVDLSDEPAPASSETVATEQEEAPALDQTLALEKEPASNAESSLAQSSVDKLLEPKSELEVAPQDSDENQVVAEEQAVVTPSPWPDPINYARPESPTDEVVTKDLETAESSSKPSEPLSEELATKEGQIKLLFTLKKGNYHGYIAPDDGSKDILFHQKYINADIFEELQRGARVVATIKHLKGKVYATHVKLL